MILSGVMLGWGVVNILRVYNYYGHNRELIKDCCLLTGSKDSAARWVSIKHLVIIVHFIVIVCTSYYAVNY